VLKARGMTALGVWLLEPVEVMSCESNMLPHSGQVKRCVSVVVIQG